eukprot:2528720-Amphidinium_carterae.1
MHHTAKTSSSPGSASNSRSSSCDRAAVLSSEIFEPAQLDWCSPLTNLSMRRGIEPRKSNATSTSDLNKMAKAHVVASFRTLTCNLLHPTSRTSTTCKLVHLLLRPLRHRKNLSWTGPSVNGALNSRMHARGFGLC